MTPRPRSPPTAKNSALETVSSQIRPQATNSLGLPSTAMDSFDNKRLKIDHTSASQKHEVDTSNNTTTKSESKERTKLKYSLTKEEGEKAIVSLQDLIKFPTVSSTAAESGAYVKCANYIIDQLHSLGILSDIHILEESPKSMPIVVGCWKGSEPDLPIILLNSHYDVVPADTKDWSIPPFEGFRQNGNIYGRGTQDMKCVCIQYIEALRKISTIDPSFKPTRSIYLTFVPDEENDGRGMAAFLDSKLYKTKLAQQGIALALDEGMASETSTYTVFRGERLPWVVNVTAEGPTGHGSHFVDHTAVGQLMELSQKALEFRQEQRSALGLDKHSNCAHAIAAANLKKKKLTLGDVTSLNITTLEAGVKAEDSSLAYNCVPPVAKCSMDIRISPNTQPQCIADMLDMWCRECSSDPSQGYELTWKHVYTDSYIHATTSVDLRMNPWYGTFCNTMSDMGFDIEPQIFPAATDSRFLRALGIRALGFSPMRNTEIMLHEIDEYIPEETFLEGIGVYVGLILELCKQGKEMDNYNERKKRR